MKAKSILELATLTAALYSFSKDKQLLDKIGNITDYGREKINGFLKESLVDEDGKEMDLFEKLSFKASEVKDDLDDKISSIVENLYERLNIAHVHKLNILEEKLDQLKREIAVAEARINHLEKQEK